MKAPKKGTLTAGVFGVALLVASGLSGSSYRRDMRAIRDQIDRLGSHIFEADCGMVEYARVGSGYPVLVIHGNGGGFDQGLELARGYLEPGFQVIAPSRFGYLRSPVPAGATPARQADAYAC